MGVNMIYKQYMWFFLYWCSISSAIESDPRLSPLRKEQKEQVVEIHHHHTVIKTNYTPLACMVHLGKWTAIMFCAKHCLPSIVEIMFRTSYDVGFKTGSALVEQQS